MPQASASIHAGEVILTRLVSACVFAFALGGLAACGSDGVAVPQVPDAVSGDAESVDLSEGAGADWPKEIWLPEGLTAMSQVVRQVDGKTAASLTGMVMTSRDELYRQVIDAVGQPETEESAGEVTRLQYSNIMPGHIVNYVLEGDPGGTRTTFIATSN